MDTTKTRLLDFIKSKGIGQGAFEKSVGLSNGYINNLKSSPSSASLQKILCKYPELNENWLLTGNGQMLKNTDIIREIPDGMTELPLLPMDAMAGLLTGGDISVMGYECEKYIVPMFKGADFLVRVNGDSMTPQYFSGDLVACKKVPMDSLWFQWGKTYVIATTQGMLIKRIEPSGQKEYISIHSENIKYKPFDLPASEIKGVALVVGMIRTE